MAERILKERSRFSMNIGKENTPKRNSKQLMEKRRRARINNCLETLKEIVLKETKQDVGQFSKLEKADILEMTVKYMTDRQHKPNSETPLKTPPESTSQTDTDMISYEGGYQRCTELMTQYIAKEPTELPDLERVRLMTHLSAQFQSISGFQSGENIMNDINGNILSQCDEERENNFNLNVNNGGDNHALRRGRNTSCSNMNRTDVWRPW